MINYSKIMYAFEGDKDISKYCDKNDKELEVEKLVLSIFKKLLEYEETEECDFYDLSVENEVVGYGFNYKNILISFGVNKKFRNKENLKKVFEIIKGKFNSDFETYMWERNERAVNWLRKCGMTEVESNIDKVIKLKYICQ
jgi:hypothetical protein